VTSLFLGSYCFSVVSTGHALAYHHFGRGVDVFLGGVVGALIMGGFLMLKDGRRFDDNFKALSSNSKGADKVANEKAARSRSPSPRGVAEQPSSPEGISKSGDPASAVSKHASLKWGDDELAEGCVIFFQIQHCTISLLVQRNGSCIVVSTFRKFIVAVLKFKLFLIVLVPKCSSRVAPI